MAVAEDDEGRSRAGCRHRLDRIGHADAGDRRWQSVEDAVAVVDDGHAQGQGGERLRQRPSGMAGTEDQHRRPRGRIGLLAGAQHGEIGKTLARRSDELDPPAAALPHLRAERDVEAARGLAGGEHVAGDVDAMEFELAAADRAGQAGCRDSHGRAGLARGRAGGAGRSGSRMTPSARWRARKLAGLMTLAARTRSTAASTRSGVAGVSSLGQIR